MEYLGKEDKQTQDRAHKGTNYDTAVQDNTRVQTRQFEQPRFESAALDNFETMGGKRFEMYMEADRIEKENAKKQKQPPKPTAKELWEENKGNLELIAQKVSERVPKEEKLVRELLGLCGLTENDDLAMHIVNAMDDVQLSATPQSTLRMLRDAIDDIWHGAGMDPALERLDRYLNETSDAPSLDYETLAIILKQEINKPENEQRLDKIKDIIDLIAFDKAARQKLEVIYEGSLMADISKTSLANLFSLESTGEAPININSLSDFMGNLIMEETSGGIGFQYKYIVPGDGTLSFIMSEFQVSAGALEECNGWKIAGDKIKTGKAAPRFLQVGELVMLPANLHIPPDISVMKKLGNGQYQELKKEEPFSNRTTTHFPDVAQELEKLISHDINNNKERILQLLRENATDTISMEELTKHYRACTGITILEDIERQLKAIAGIKRNTYISAGSLVPSTPSFMLDDPDYSIFEEASKILAAGKSISQTREQRQANKYQGHIKETNNVELWDGLSIDSLAERAAKALSSGLKKPHSKVDSQKLLSALASLRFKEGNIEAFKEAYRQKSGNFEKDLQQANKFEYLFKRRTEMPGYYNVGGTSHNVYKPCLSDEALVAALSYLRPDPSVYDSKTTYLEDYTPVKTLHRDKNNVPMLKGLFDNGTFIKLQKTAGAPPTAYYVVDNGEVLERIAEKLKLRPKDLKKLNGFKDHVPPGGDKKESGDLIFPGQLLKIPSKCLYGRDFMHVEGNKISKETYKPQEHLYMEGGRWKINAESYNPYLIHSILDGIFTGGKKNDVGSFMFDLEIYVNAKLLAVLYIQAGVAGNIEAETGDDRSFTISTRVQFRLEGGTAILNFKKAWNIFGQTNNYLSTDHYATHFNHDVYNLLLSANQVMPGFVGYWDDDYNENLLHTDYTNVSKGVAVGGKAGKTKAGGATLTRSKKQAPKFVGDTSEPAQKSMSGDYAKKRGKQNNLDEETSFEGEFVVYDNGLLTVTLQNYRHDPNKDNEGSYMNVAINLTYQNIRSVLEHLGQKKNGNGTPATQGGEKSGTKETSAEKEKVMKDGMAQISDNIAKDIKDLFSILKFAVDVAKTKKLKENADKLNNRLGGGNSKKKKEAESDIGGIIDFMYIFEGGEAKLLYTRTSVQAAVEAEVEVPMVKGVVSVSGGIKFQSEYKRSVLENPGTTSIAYVSTVYNGLMRQTDPLDNEIAERDAIFRQAQQARINYIKVNTDKDKQPDDETVKEAYAIEKDIIGKYWENYASKVHENRTAYHTNERWDAYKSDHISELVLMFKYFLEPIVKYASQKLNTSDTEVEPIIHWEDIKDLRFISAEQAERFMGENVIDVLTDPDMFGVKEDDLIDYNATIKNLAKKEQFFLFEKYILFNLYKEHQKHEWDYFNFVEMPD